MIATADVLRKQNQQVQAQFLTMLPIIRRQARVAFKNVRREQREELVAEVIAHTYCAYVRLVQLGKADVAFGTPLADYAVRHVRAGRLAATKMNVRDVTSRYCQRRKKLQVERLDVYDRQEEEWRALLVEDRHVGPAETAAMRIDFAAWLRRLPSRLRRIAETLALGEATKAVAGRFGLSPARISQLRQELKASWELFIGDYVPAAAPT
jgi:hypothetical protein